MTSSQPTHKHPVLLFPVRLETRFIDKALLVRIYPDDVLIESHDGRLTPDECQAMSDYREAVGGATSDKKRLATWRGLVERVGRTRAAYLVSLSESDCPDDREEGWSGAPYVRVLPDKFVAYLDDGRRVISQPGRQVHDQLPLLKEPTNAAGGGDALFADDAAWVADFDTAEQVGMAIRIPIAKERDQFARLIVVGLSDDKDTKRGKEDLEKLLEGHRFTTGLSLVPYGTPTNNTADVQSGYTDDDEDVEHSYPIEIGEALANNTADVQSGYTDDDDDVEHSDPIEIGEALAKALGVEIAAFEHVGHAHDLDSTYVRDIHTALWPALGDYYVTHMLPDPLSEKDRLRLSRHFSKFVRACGPLPSIRVGRQPYGVLPVTGVRGWRASTFDAVGLSGSEGEESKRFYSILHEVLISLFYQWLSITDDERGLVPRLGGSDDPDEELMQVLAMQPASADFHLQTVVDDRFVAWLLLDSGTDYFSDESEIGCDTVEECVDLWGRASADERHPATQFITRLGEEIGLKAGDLEKSRILDVFGWGEVSPTNKELGHSLATNLQTEGNSLAYLSSFRPGEAVPAQDASQPLLYDFLRRAVLYDNRRAMETVQKAVQDFEPSISPSSLNKAVADVLDLHSHRLDAWLTSLATRRLAAMRSRDETAKGIYTGAYGWVEELQRGARTTGVEEGGYIHAPSPAHAAAGAVLRNAYLTHREEDDGDAFRINLSSRRVRRAWRLLKGIREGQALGALLGYQFERGLHERNKDEFIDNFRSAYPLDTNSIKQAEEQEAVETVTARNVVDGLSLTREWTRYHDTETTGKTRTEIQAKWTRHGLYSPDGLTSQTTLLNPTDVDVEEELNSLAGSLDAFTDLLMYEGVYQEIQGNYERSSAALDAMAGETLPPEPESIQTPLAGAAFTQRVCLLLQPEWANRVNHGRGTQRPPGPRAMAEPILAGWFAEILGDMADIGCVARVTVHRDDEFEEYEPLDLNKARASELTALTGQRQRRIAHSIYSDRRRYGPFENVMAVTRVIGVDEGMVHGWSGKVTVNEPQVVSLRDLDIDAVDFLYLSSAVPEAITSSLGVRESKEENQRAGETELEARIKYYVRQQNRLGSNCEVIIDFGPHPEKFSRSIAEALEMGRAVLSLLEGARPLKPASLLRPEDQETSAGFNDGDFWELDKRLGEAQEKLSGLTADQFFELSRYGIEGAIPPSPVSDPDCLSRGFAVEQIRKKRVDQCKEDRLEAVGLAFPLDDRAKDIDQAIEKLVQAMKALFGKAFVVLPRCTPAQEDGVSGEQRLEFDDEERVRLWLQQAAQTHSALGKLEDALLATEVWRTPAVQDWSDVSSHAQAFVYEPPHRLSVFQLSEGDAPYWLALSDEEAEAELSSDAIKQFREEIADNGWPRGVLSLVVVTPEPIPTHGEVVGLVIDEWNELIPSAKRSTGISFQYDRPNAQAPQSLLVAVPSQRPGGDDPWTQDELYEIVNDTLDLAKIRCVDVDALDEVAGRFFPATMLPADAKSPGWLRQIDMPGLADRLTGTIEVTVEDQQGGAISGGHVQVSGVLEGGELQSDGVQSLQSFKRVPIGEHEIEVSVNQYESARKSIWLGFRETERVKFVLAAAPPRKWREGWTSVAFYTIGEQTYLFMLKETDGRVLIHRVDGSDGSIGREVKRYDWAPGWTNVVFYRVSGGTFLFLKKTDGKCLVYRMNNDGTVGDIIERREFGYGQRTVGSYSIKDHTYLFELEASSGRSYQIYRINTDGSLGEKVDEQSIERHGFNAWTDINFYAVAGQTYVCLTSERTDLQLHVMRADGRLGQQILPGSIGYDLQLVESLDGRTEEDVIQEFERECESENKRCAVLIVRAGRGFYKWTVAAFSSERGFRDDKIDPNDDLSRELEKESKNKRLIFDMAVRKLQYDHCLDTDARTLERDSSQGVWRYALCDATFETGLFLLKEEDGRVYTHRIGSSGMPGERLEDGRLDQSNEPVQIAFYTVAGQTYLFLLKEEFVGSSYIVHRMHENGLVGEEVARETDDRGRLEGWSSIAPYALGDRAFLFRLKERDGSMLINQINPGGILGSELRAYEWAAGWTSVAFYRVQDQTYLFRMKDRSRKVRINRMLAGGTVGELVQSDDLRNPPVSAFFYGVGGQIYLCVMSDEQPNLLSRQVNADGALGEVIDEDWEWWGTSVAVYATDVRTYLYIIKEGSPYLYIRSVNTDGSFGAKVEDHKRALYLAPWSSVGVCNAASGTCLFLLSEGDSELHSYRIKDDGSLGEEVESYAICTVGSRVSLLLLRERGEKIGIHRIRDDGSPAHAVMHCERSAGWTKIIFYTVGRETFVFLRNQNDGNVLVYLMNDNGTVGEEVERYALSTRWTSVAFFTVDSETYLFLLKESNGEVRITPVEPDGRIRWSAVDGGPMGIPDEALRQVSRQDGGKG